MLSGLALFLYPSVSNLVNSRRQSKAINAYRKNVEALSEPDYRAELAAAEAFNRSLLENHGVRELDGAEIETYKSLLSVSENGEMGYLEIPKLALSLPVYHTTEKDVLQFALGHLPGTSLPIGGKGTHAVISGHRGLSSAKLFTDLDQMKTGDRFGITVLGEKLLYEVDRILTVEPEESGMLAIDPERDLVTLVTCTPYGINTHRLLIRGHRVGEGESEEKAVRIASEALRIDPKLPSLLIACILLILSMALSGVRRGIKRRKTILRRSLNLGKD